MDIGTTTNVNASQYRATTAIGDRDVGQKGSFYRRQRRDKKQTTEEKTLPTRTTSKGEKHTIDIRV